MTDMQSTLSLSDMERIPVSIGHRCSAHRLFKLISKKIYLHSFFDGCFGDLFAHLELLHCFYSGDLGSLSYGIIENKSRMNRFFVSYAKVNNQLTCKRKSRALLFEGKAWTSRPLLGYCYDLTEDFTKWRQRDILLTDRKHFFFTHCPAFDYSELSVCPSPSDFQVRELWNNGKKGFDYFYLSRVLQINSKTRSFHNLMLQLLTWDQFKRPQDRLFVVIPYVAETVMMDESRPLTYPVVRFFSEDPSVTVWGLELPAGTVQKTIYDIDFSDTWLQGYVSSAMITIRRLYADLCR